MDSPIHAGQYRELRAGEIGVVLPDFRYLVRPYARPLVLETRGFMVGSSPLFRKARPQTETSKGDHEWEQKCCASLKQGHDPTVFLLDIIVSLALDVAVDDQRSRIRETRDAA
jgi:hypothetical protein